MGFLDTTTWTLDAVLTDLGRKRLAEGNGLNIRKFALGDDEIDYALWDAGADTPDANILATPVLEAFTNNMSSMKSRLLSLPSTAHLYLPVIKLANFGESQQDATYSTHLLLVDEPTVDALTGPNSTVLDPGLLRADRPQAATNLFRVDQGLDTGVESNEATLDPDLLETQYVIQLDNRLGSLTGPLMSSAPLGQNVSLNPTSIDDDQIASYIVTYGRASTTGNSIVTRLTPGDTTSIQGPPGTRLTFKYQASLNTRSSYSLFDRIGTAGALAGNITNTETGLTLTGANYTFIDSVIRVSGVHTGYTMDLPIRLIKQN